MVGKAPERPFYQPSRRRQATDGEKLADGTENLVHMAVGLALPFGGLSGYRGRGICSHYRPAPHQ
jgi:hypothetical protein